MGRQGSFGTARRASRAGSCPWRLCSGGPLAYAAEPDINTPYLSNRNSGPKPDMKNPKELKFRRQRRCLSGHVANVSRWQTSRSGVRLSWTRAVKLTRNVDRQGLAPTRCS